MPIKETVPREQAWSGPVLDQNHLKTVLCEHSLQLDVVSMFGLREETKKASRFDDKKVYLEKVDVDAVP